MKYEVSKKGSSVTFKFETYEQAADFCYMYVMSMHVKGDRFPELSIKEITE
ncbi:hypothetical protein ACIXNQ_08520 [Bacteroides fragilis]|jgi:hypothetical protein